MSNNTTTIRFNKEEKKLLDLYMEFQDKSLTTVMKESLFEDISDFFDNITSEEAIEYNKKNTRKYTSEQVMKELGLD